ncbi:MAG TPA: DNA repair protein RecO [Candidatus Magasanikbacteria bacterium]|nr:DNA repair protein RecO [Candidatus Magasanikbacteria bacterium]
MLAFVLYRRDFREADQIISFYTLEKGKMEILTRGVKKITSKNSAHLEPFSLVEAEVILGKELNYLGAVQPINYFVSIRKKLQKSLAAGFLVSTLDKLLHEGEKDERIFDLIVSWLEYVDNQYTVYGIHLLDSYVVRLLSYLGLDIVESDKIPTGIKNDLEMLSKENWEIINKLEYKKSVHDFIYKFLLYNTDRKVNDWGKILK